MLMVRSKLTVPTLSSDCSVSAELMASVSPDWTIVRVAETAPQVKVTVPVRRLPVLAVTVAVILSPEEPEPAFREIQLSLTVAVQLPLEVMVTTAAPPLWATVADVLLSSMLSEP